MTIDTNELRMLAQDFKLAGSPMFIQTTQMNELLDRLEAAESARRNDYQNWMTALDRNAELLAKLEAAEKERDALRTVLTDLLNDLEERAKWNLEASQRIVACGNGVYMRAKAALEET